MKTNLILVGVLVLLITAGITGCGGEPTAVAPSDGSSAALSQRTAVSELKETTMTPVPTSEATEPTPPPEAEQVVRLAVEDLGKRLGLSPEQIRLVSVEAVDWSDTSLGCPQPGMMYAQVITPGFRVVLEVNGEQYEYHTDAGRFVVLCDVNKTSNAESTGSDPAVQDGGPNQPIGGDVIIAPPTSQK